ncbi:histidine-rich glycoprotein [Anopheles arabiensis]|uniref:AGAP002743-PA n=6 Tax=gambiae species complex TaxID=44542 RepID=Q7QCP6_ANOGA|nr:histidine-rich glycoprotein [Anopheles arabiensis]XP_040226320.1 histidine-rich glycoprotein [Anopheles coluzzii]XP_041765543.1 histidine-rich glycoprotein [Anopheles merus]XP_312177.3 histidine-rich glycoprotein [Anopheles gambiae]EAA07811.3 AGAP002743-PA [Anopheles gambiae str. PEST]
MFKSIIFVTLFVGVCYAGLIHHHDHDDDVSETEHHHNIEHKHATSHQSFKFHHFHAVPVYVKKEDQQFLKHPVEISGLKHNLKIVHPETEQHHGHGLTLENHSEFESKLHGGHGYDLGHAGSEHIGQEHGYGGHEFEQHQFGHELDEQEE